MQKTQKSIEWWETKSFAVGELIMSILIGGTFSYVKPLIGVPLLVGLFFISCLLMWHAYSKTFVAIPPLLTILIPSILNIFCIIGLVVWQSYYSEPKQLNFAAPDALTALVLQNMDIRIADLVRESPVIRNKSFNNCVLYGPAVIALKGKADLIRCTLLTDDINDCFMPSEEKFYWGVIMFDDCTFIHCKFRSISFVGSPRIIEKIKQQTVLERN
ncbi:MAG: hypothetical protein ABSH16_05540 [Sedimentisphaerales bacterium]